MREWTENEWIEKLWGWTRCVDRGEFFSRHEIAVRPGGRCSLHWHSLRANDFVVLAGSLIVTDPEGDHLLLPGDRLRVLPLALHMFVSPEGCSALEEYHGPDDPLDIRRLVVFER